MKNKEKLDTCGTLSFHRESELSIIDKLTQVQKGQKLVNEKMESPHDGEHGGGGESSQRVQLLQMTMNIEAMLNQKQQWYQVHSKGVRIQHTCFLNHSYTFLVKHNLLNVCISSFCRE
jgi:hypothetical protein